MYLWKLHSSLLIYSSPATFFITSIISYVTITNSLDIDLNSLTDVPVTYILKINFWYNAVCGFIYSRICHPNNQFIFVLYINTKV